MSTSFSGQTITVIASASYSQDDAPVYDLLINGTIEAVGTVASNQPISQTYTVSLPLDTAETVVIDFTNYDSPSQMLNVQSIDVDGTSIASSTPGEQYVSSHGTYDQWSQMYFGGQITIPVPASDFTGTATVSGVSTSAGSVAASGSGTVAGNPGSVSTAPSSGISAPPSPPAGITTAYTIGVAAAACFDAGHAPEISLLVDGIQIGTADFSSATTQTQVFVANLEPNVTHDIDIVYTNHTDSAQMLNVGSITVNGQAIATGETGETYVSSVGTYQQWGQMYFGGTIDVPVAASYFPPPAAASVGTSGSSSSGASQGQTAAGSGQSAAGSAPGGVIKPSAYYLSPNGSDGNSGGASAPFASLAHAIRMMEATGIHTLYVNAGSYDIANAISLSATDNGDQILAAAGATPVLDAGGGTPTLLQLNSVSGVTIAGFVLENASASPQSAALTLIGSDGNTLSHDTFLSDGEGVLLAGGSSNNSVSQDLFERAQSSAIEVKDASNGNTISFNEINGVGALTTQGGAVYAHGVANLTISHNLVENTAGAALTLADFTPGQTTLSDELIEDNVLVNIGTDATSSDYGAIYDLGRSGNDQNTVIEDNYVHGVGSGNPNAHAEGIYLDDLASGVTVQGNIVDGLNGNSDAMEIHGGQSITVAGNLFNLQQQGKAAIYFAAPPGDFPGAGTPFTGSSITGNIILTQQGAPAGAFADFDGTASSGPLLAVISSNDFWLPADPGFYPMGNLTDRSPAFANPQISLDNAGSLAAPFYVQAAGASGAYLLPEQHGWGLGAVAIGAS